MLKQSFENKIILRTLKINNVFRLGSMEFDGAAVTLDIKRTLKISGLHLENLIINPRRDNEYIYPMHLIYRNISSVCISAIERIQLADPSSTISKSCVEFFVSNQLLNLTTLNIFLMMHHRTAIDANDNLWYRLRVFCNTKLESYDICIRQANGDLLFSYNNRFNIEDGYVNQRYPILSMIP